MGGTGYSQIFYTETLKNKVRVLILLTSVLTIRLIMKINRSQDRVVSTEYKLGQWNIIERARNKPTGIYPRNEWS